MLRTLNRIELKTSRIGAQLILRIRINTITFFIDVSRDLEVTHVETIADNRVAHLVEPINNLLCIGLKEPNDTETAKNLVVRAELYFLNEILASYFGDVKPSKPMDELITYKTDYDAVLDHFEFEYEYEVSLLGN